MTAQRWTKEEIELLKKLAGTASCPQIGAKIGKTRDAVKNQIKRLKLPMFDHTKLLAAPIAEPAAPKNHWQFVAGVMISVGLFLREMTPEDRRKAMVAAEKALTTDKPAVVPTTAPVASDPTLKPSKPIQMIQRPVQREESGLQWCPACFAPVSNWQEHYSRTGHKWPA